MEFRYPSATAQSNAKSLRYLTESLSNPKKGEEVFSQLLEELGNTVETYPIWHPLLTIPSHEVEYKWGLNVHNIDAYQGIDHTVFFIRGFVTCPYNKDQADRLVERVDAIVGLRAYRLDTALYSDAAYPVVVVATDVKLEADGTIRGRDALVWCVEQLVSDANETEVAETWWNLRTLLLGTPNGSRSSILVNQNTGSHMRKILEAMNDSGMFGPIKEWSLDMFSKRKKEAISRNLIMTAYDNRNDLEEDFEFELRGETCKAIVRDTWKDGMEFYVEVVIGGFENPDLSVRGFYHPKKDHLNSMDPSGKRSLAEKFS